MTRTAATLAIVAIVAILAGSIAGSKEQDRFAGSKEQDPAYVPSQDPAYVRSQGASSVRRAGPVFGTRLSAQQKPAAQDPPRSPRLFKPQDLGLLEPPDREAWQKPDQVMDALHIADGSVVADIGAGGGWFTTRLARRVGPGGRVYAVDVQRLMIQAIVRRTEREGLSNVHPVLGEYDDPKLPADARPDAVLMVDAFHEMEHPVVMLRNVARTLKPQGRIGIIDYREGDGGPGPSSEERVPPSVVISQAQAAGLRLIEEHKFLPYQYFLIFGK